MSEFAGRLRRSPVAIVSGAALLLLLAAGLGAGWVAPVDVFDPAHANVVDANLAPSSTGMFGDRYLLGTDPQGRDLLSAMIYGLRSSLLVGIFSVALAACAGVTLGLVSGYFGGILDTLVMRAADVQLSFPSILIALLVDGIVRAFLTGNGHDVLAIPVLILSIALSYWVQYARVVRGSVLVERGREYVQSATVTRVPTHRILLTHILPNVLRPVVVLATVNLSLAILAEATLSFLGVGVPPTEPSLGTLVRIGGEFLLSGEWWVALLPGGLLVVLCLATNVLGDWLRDVLDPRLDIA